jgi:hypothetical protein
MGVVSGYNVEEMVGKKRKCVRYLSDQLAWTERDRHMCHISKWIAFQVEILLLWQEEIALPFGHFHIWFGCYFTSVSCHFHLISPSHRPIALVIFQTSIWRSTFHPFWLVKSAVVCRATFSLIRKLYKEGSRKFRRPYIKWQFRWRSQRWRHLPQFSFGSLSTLRDVTCIGSI